MELDHGDADSSSPPFKQGRAEHALWCPIFHTGDCGIYFCWQKPATLPGQRVSWLRIVVSGDDAEVEARWRLRSGRTGHARLAGSHVWIVPPDMWHAADWHRSAGLVAIQIERSAVEGVTATPIKNISVAPLRDYTAGVPLIGELCANLWDECRDVRPLDRLTVGGMGQALAGHVLRAHFAPRNRSDPQQWILLRGQLANVRAHVEAHLDGDLSLDALARVVSLSPSYFGQVFRAATGLPPAAFVAGARVRRARELLRTGQHTATEVTHLVGFSSQQLMTVTFRRLLGTLPSDYLPRTEKIRALITNERKRVRWRFC
jgi:AraC-like DNA-binding protein